VMELVKPNNSNTNRRVTLLNDNNIWVPFLEDCKDR